MGRNVGMGILRMLSVIGGVCILAIVVLTAGTMFMPGTKIGHVFGASAEALAGEDSEGRPIAGRTRTLAQFAGAPDAGSGAAADAGSGPAVDAGTGAAGASGGQGSGEPGSAQGLPEQQGR